MKQETNTAATTLEQVNAMPAATWGWLRMNQTKLELSDELAVAPAEAVEVEGLDEQFTGVADAFDAAMDAMAERFPERRASAPGDAADRARITPETELDVPATSVYQAGAIKLEEELSPRGLRDRHGRGCLRLPGRPRHQAHRHRCPRIPARHGYRARERCRCSRGHRRHRRRRPSPVDARSAYCPGLSRCRPRRRGIRATRVRPRVRHRQRDLHADARR
ncbi:MAG: hypothetical protein ACLTXI_03490 [Collinsella sp.]